MLLIIMLLLLLLVFQLLLLLLLLFMSFLLSSSLMLLSSRYPLILPLVLSPLLSLLSPVFILFIVVTTQKRVLYRPAECVRKLAVCGAIVCYMCGGGMCEKGRYGIGLM